MILRRTLLSAVLLLLAVLIEVTVLAPLPFPGATPMLVRVVVVLLAGQYGASTGAACGFAGGLLLDIAPPAAGTIGTTPPPTGNPRPRSSIQRMTPAAASRP